MLLTWHYYLFYVRYYSALTQQDADDLLVFFKLKSKFVKKYEGMFLSYRDYLFLAVSNGFTSCGLLDVIYFTYVIIAG